MSEALLVIIWIFFIGILGLLIGSFLNVCIYRLPAGITIVKGHSFCPNCKHPLSSLDLFPVFSYLLLGRKCRYCHEPISSRYMKIELLTGVYFALAAWFLRPGQVSLPNWLPAMSGGDFEASLILALSAGLVFSALLVWAMILWDQNDVPFGLFIFAAIPVMIILVMKPEMILIQILALFVSLLFTFALMLLKLIPTSANRERTELVIGLGLLALHTGLIASVAILIVCLIELLIIKTLTTRNNTSANKQTSLMWRSLPLQTLLIGSVLWLLFRF